MSDNVNSQIVSAPNKGIEAILTAGLFSSKKLFGSRKEIRIEHFGEIYSLRMTRNGKLILTK